MESITKQTAPLTQPRASGGGTTLASWKMPSCQVSLVVRDTRMEGIVRTDKKHRVVRLEAPFTVSDIPLCIQQNYTASVRKLHGVFKAVVLKLRPEERFYSRTSPLNSVVDFSLKELASTPQQLVAALKKLKTSDPRTSIYRECAIDFITWFRNRAPVVASEINGLVSLVRLDDPEIAKEVINVLSGRIKDETLLDLHKVHALSDAIDRADPALLDADDLWKVLLAITKLTDETFTRGAEGKLEKELQALTRVLNSMVDSNVCDFPKEKQEQIRKVLTKFSDSKSIDVRFLAAYAVAALSQIPNDESKLAALFRVATGLAKGAFFFYVAINKSDPNAIADGFLAFKSSVEGVQALLKLVALNLDDALDNLKEVEDNVKAASVHIKLHNTWYDEIRQIDMLITSSAFPALQKLLLDGRFQKTPRVIYFLVKRLDEVIMSHPSLQVRQETIGLLQSLYQEDDKWNSLSFKEKYFEKEGPTKFTLLHRGDIRDWIAIKAMIVSYLVSYSVMPDLQEAAKQALESIRVCALRRAKELEFVGRHSNASMTLPSDVGQEPELTSSRLALERKLGLLQERMLTREDYKNEEALHVPLKASRIAGSGVSRSLQSETLKFLKPTAKERVLLLVGPAGSGKTFFSQILAKMLWRNYEPFIGKIPVYVWLPRLTAPDTSLVEQVLAEFTAAEIAQLGDREIIWILDGYDEIAADTKLLQKNRLLDFPGKIIVTTRQEAITAIEHFTPSSGHESNPSLLRELYLAPFNRKDIERFIQKYVNQGHTPWKSVARYLREFDSIPEVQGLVENPFTLKIVVDILPGLKKRLGSGTPMPVTRYALYSEYIEKWLDAEYQRIDGEIKGLSVNGLLKDDVIREARAFCVQLANALLSKGVRSFSRKEMLDVNRWVTISPTDKKEELLRILRSMAPLRVTEDGAYAFKHDWFRQFFVAFGAKEALALHSMGSAFFQELLEPSVWLFLADLAKEDKAFKGQLWKVMMDSKRDWKVAMAAANAASIWNLADFRFVGDDLEDLQDVKLPGAWLERANLAQADLRGADLTDAKLFGAVLDSARLDGAKMKGTQLVPWQLIETHEPVTKLIPSQDGSALIGILDTSSRNDIDGDVVGIWDIQSGKALRWLDPRYPNEPHRSLHEQLDSLTLLDRGKFLAAGGFEGTIVIWQLDSDKGCQFLTGHKNRVCALIPLEGKNRFASADWDGVIIIWDMTNWSVLMMIKTTTVFALAYYPHLNWLISAHEDGAIRIHDLALGNIRDVLNGHVGSVHTLALIGQGRFLASGGEDKTIRIWDVESGKERRKFEGHDAHVMELRTLQNSEQFVSYSLDLTVRIWDLFTGQSRLIARGPNILAHAMALVKESGKLALGIGNSKIMMYDLNRAGELKNVSAHSWGIRSVVPISDDKGRKRCASISVFTDRTIRIWDVETGQELMRYMRPTQLSWENPLVDLSSRLCHVNGRLVVTEQLGARLSTRDSPVSVWDVLNSKSLSTLPLPDELSWKFLEVVGILDAQSFEKPLSTWRAKMKAITEQSPEKGKHLEKGVFVQKGTGLVNLDSNGEIQIWRLNEDGPQALKGSAEQVIKAVIDDGNKLVTKSLKGVTVWNLQNSTHCVLAAASSAARCAFMAVGPGLLITTSPKDNELKIWDTTSGQLLGNICGPNGTETLLVIQPDLLLAAGNWGEMRCWKIHFEQQRIKWQMLWSKDSLISAWGIELGHPVDLSKENEQLLLEGVKKD